MYMYIHCTYEYKYHCEERCEEVTRLFVWGDKNVIDSYKK